MDYPNAFRFTMFDDAADEAEKCWILKNAIALEEDSTWFGAPEAGKSALLLDMAFHLAMRSSWQWHEYVVNDAAPENEYRGTIYFAPERAKHVRSRIAAYVQRYKPPALPIAVVDDALNLTDPKCVDQIVETVRKFEKETQCQVGLIVIDTFSKALGGGDEDKAQVQNLAAANLKSIHDQISVHIATIGHTGKNESAGERGSNAKLGHVDLAVHVTVDKNGVRKATIVKGNDQPRGLIAAFRIEGITVLRKYMDGADREPLMTSMVAPYDPYIFKNSRPVVSAAPTGKKQVAALDALKRVLETHGKDGAVHVDYWREELARVGLLDPKAKNPWQPFARIKNSVSEHISETDKLISLENSITVSSHITPP
jgi:AAA domain